MRGAAIRRRFIARRFASTLLIALAAVGGLAPATLAQMAPRWLVGREVIDGRSGRKVRSVEDLGDHRLDQQYWLGSEQYSCGAAVVDLARDEVVDHRVGWFALRGFDGKARWAIRSLASFDPHCCPVLARDHVVYVTKAGVLRALDRATGRLVWEHEDAPEGLLAVEGDLVVVADRKPPRAHGRQVEVAAYALANGRLAFRAELPAVAQRLVVTDAGIAVMGRKYAVVHDRFGPRVLTVDGVTFDIRGSKDGWFVLRPYELEAFDRAGNARWKVRRPLDVRTAAALEILPDGGVLTWKRDLNVDKGVGFVCRSPVDGSTRWQSDVASPGKFEPPYRPGRVEVRATARGIYLLSLTSTGSVVAELSPKTGEQKKLVDLRPKPKRRVRRRLPAKGR